MCDDAARYLQEYKTSFFRSDISGSITENPQIVLQSCESKSFEVRYFALLGHHFCVAGCKAVKFFGKPLNPVFILPHKNGGKSFFLVLVPTNHTSASVSVLT
jgi:hypothetical protein